MRLEELRVWLAKELRVEGLPDQVWDLLVKRKYAKEDLDDTDVEILVDKTRDFLAVSGTGTRPPGRQSREEREDEISAWLDNAERERTDVFKEHVARMAAQHPSVQAFRSEILGERFPLSYEEALEEFVDEDGAIHGPSPHAGQLAELTKELERVYFWKGINASWFVLTGYVPVVNTFKLRISHTWRPHGPKVATVTLTVEPWLSAEKVQQIYRDVQRRLLGGKDNGRVGERSLKLLQFVAEHRESANVSWQELRRLWNATYPEWAYTAEDSDKAKSKFYNAHKRAYGRVIEPDYGHGGRFGWSLSRTERQERIEQAVKGPDAEITSAKERKERNRREGGSFTDARRKRDST